MLRPMQYGFTVQDKREQLLRVLKMAAVASCQPGAKNTNEGAVEALSILCAFARRGTVIPGDVIENAEQSILLEPLPMSLMESQDTLLGIEPFVEPAHRIYPKKIDGQFRRIKWSIQFLTLGIYYLLPFVRWDRRTRMRPLKQSW